MMEVMSWVMVNGNRPNNYIRVLAMEDVKKHLFYIFKHYFIYFTNPFNNIPNIPIFIFTYNPIK